MPLNLGSNYQEKLERAKANNIEFDYEFVTIENKFFDVI